MIGYDPNCRIAEDERGIANRVDVPKGRVSLYFSLRFIRILGGLFLGRGGLLVIVGGFFYDVEDGGNSEFSGEVDGSNTVGVPNQRIGAVFQERQNRECASCLDGVAEGGVPSTPCQVTSYPYSLRSSTLFP